MTVFGALFSDRRDAARQLAAALGHLRSADPLILALPRGGVPVGFEIARALDADLDILLVRKIGAPGHEELGLGAIVEGAEATLVLNEEIVRMVGASADYIEAECRRQLAEIERRRQVYQGAGPAIDVTGRTVILVDDGIATGGTVKAALAALRRHRPARLVLAVPVAAPETLAALRPSCDEIVCLATPAHFAAVGAYYADFTQTEDTEVVRLLTEARRFKAGKDSSA